MSFSNGDVMANCRDCGAVFFRAADETWKVRCIDCFKQSKAKQAARAENGLSAYWQRRAAELEDENGELNRRLEQQDRNIRILTDRLSAKSSGPAWLVAELKDEQLRRLLLCCHPDRHGNSEAATKATQFLLRVRDSL